MYDIANKWKEECGVYGVYSRTEDVSEMTYFGLYALQHRGQESAGIALTDGAWMDVTRGMGLVNEVFRHQLPHMENQYIAIGHVRYSTTGSSLLANTQPLMVNYAGGKIALAHNGNLTNAAEIRHQLEQEGTIFQTSIDSEVFVNLIARSRKETIEEKVLESLQKIQGAYCLTIMTEDKLIGARDPHGFRPLCIGKLDDGTWILSSETCGLDVNGAEFVRDVEPGEIVRINNEGFYAEQGVEPGRRAACIFEYVYLARPDSVMDNISVYEARVQMGVRLAERVHRLRVLEEGERAVVVDEGDAGYDASLPCLEKMIDVVMAVPDTSRHTAISVGVSVGSDAQIATTLGKKYIEGLSKNRYIARTFIMPAQQMRQKSIRIKHNPIHVCVASGDHA